MNEEEQAKQAEQQALVEIFDADEDIQLYIKTQKGKEKFAIAQKIFEQYEKPKDKIKRVD